MTIVRGIPVASQVEMKMRIGFLLAVVLLGTSKILEANDEFVAACKNFGGAEVVFLGRAQPAVTRRISGEKEIEAARQEMLAAKAAVEAAYFPKSADQPLEGKALELARALVDADRKHNDLVASYPAPHDATVIPFEIERSFRGAESGPVFLLLDDHEWLQPGELYLVFAHRAFPTPEFLSASVLPQPESSAREALRFLSLAAEGKYDATVFGSVAVRQPGEANLLAGIPIQLTIDDERRQAVTSSAGTFMFHGVPPGKARITPMLPDPMVLEGYGSIERDIHGGGCHSVDITAVPNGRLRGRVVHDDGTPVVHRSVRLQPFHTSRGYHAEARTNDRGEYEFTRVAPGTYVLGVNIDEGPTPRLPYPTNYFPGTTDRRAAEPITVGVGTEHAGFEWTLTDRLRTGEVRFALDMPMMPVRTSVCIATRLPSGRYATTRGDDERTFVVEGGPYRIKVHGETAAGYFQSEPFDMIGTSGSTSLRVRAEMSATPGTCDLWPSNPR